MKRMMKCYRIFAGPLCRLFVFLLLPLAMLLLPAVLPVKSFFFFSVFGIALYTAFEIVADFWTFGGIARREGQLEYLKSSKRGPEVIEKALLGNLCRQVLTPLLVLCIYAVICRFCHYDEAHFSGLVGITDLLLIGYFLVAAGTTAVRFLDGVAMAMGVSGICLWFLLLADMAAVFLPWVTFFLAVPLCAAAGSGSIWLIMRRVKESYYDKKD